jgi:hypothetical protein
VSVVNDGLPLPDEGADGVGTYLLSQLSVEWSRVNLARGVRLTARVPLA